MLIYPSPQAPCAGRLISGPMFAGWECPRPLRILLTPIAFLQDRPFPLKDRTTPLRSRPRTSIIWAGLPELTLAIGRRSHEFDIDPVSTFSPPQPSSHEPLPLRQQRPLLRRRPRG